MAKVQIDLWMLGNGHIIAKSCAVMLAKLQLVYPSHENLQPKRYYPAGSIPTSMTKFVTGLWKTPWEVTKIVIGIWESVDGLVVHWYMVFGLIYMYRYRSDGAVAYVGKCSGIYGYERILRVRHKAHLIGYSPWDRLLAAMGDIHFILTVEASIAGHSSTQINRNLLAMERFFIRQMRPEHNCKCV